MGLGSMGIREHLEMDKKNIIYMVREYSRSQKELWRQVPFYAIDAYCQDGYPTEYDYMLRQAFVYGYLNIEEMSHSVYVDLTNGELVETSIYNDDFEHTLHRRRNELKTSPAPDKCVLNAILDLSCIDAHAIIEKMQWKKIGLITEEMRYHNASPLTDCGFIDSKHNNHWRSILESHWLHGFNHDLYAEIQQACK